MDKKDLRIHEVARAETLSSQCYTDKEFFEKEQKLIFENHWQYVGPASFLQKSGDQFPLSIAGQPILLVLDGDEIRAFYNVCKHRGGPLATCKKNNKVLKCEYHGWVYRLDGSLRGVPHFRHAELFNPSDFGLTEIAVTIWQGLIFVNLSADPDSGQDVFQTIEDRIKPLKIADLQFHKRVSYNIACNWKAYADNYLEGYHIPHVHPELCDLLSFQDYKTELTDHYSLQYSPFRDKENLYSQDGGAAFYFFLFPNIMLNLLPGRLQMNSIEALSEQSCRVHFDYFYDDITSQQAQKKITEDMAYSDRVQKEDMEICEWVQKGLQSNAYERGRFSPEMEEAVHHFQVMLKKVYKKIPFNS